MKMPMFCYQCEQTFQGTGCVEFGLCGKDAPVAALQDLLVYQLEGLSFFAHRLLQQGSGIRPEIQKFTLEALFSTLTNVNFDPERFLALLRESQKFKTELKNQLGPQLGALPTDIPAAAKYELPDTDQAIQEDADFVEIRPQAESNPDIQSLKDTLLYGLKGMAAYACHAWVLGYRDEQVNNFLFRGLSVLLEDAITLEELLALVMELGKVNLRCMELLDAANTETYGHPEPTQALITRKPGPFIVISGHDLRDLEMLLEQTMGKGINIYTHGEMLPALAYPGLKKYPHLVGNYGGAWQVQQREFDGLPGAILMTTNCLLEPRSSYQDRIFTTGMVGFQNVHHIPEVDGRKDFTPVIEKALELGGWAEEEPEVRIPIGFGRAAVLSQAEKIVAAVKAGQIRRFFLIGGCDGAKAGRNYYTQFAESTPPDTIMLTLACGKYRFNKGDYGTLGGLPRLLDVGQCNDAYSAIQIASALATAFDCGVNDLPLTLVLSWFEQKAVCILLTLLSLGIKDIYVGPSLPAFLTPNVVNYLVENFNLKPISTPAADLAAVMS